MKEKILEKTVTFEGDPCENRLNLRILTLPRQLCAWEAFSAMAFMRLSASP